MPFIDQTGNGFKFKWILDPDPKKPDYQMELLSDVTYVSSEGKTFVIPKGFRTDGASIPKPLWSVAGSPFTGDYRYAALLHDWLCYMGNEVKTPVCTWKEAHKLFYEAMRELGIGWFEAQTKYWAVYFFCKRW